MYVALAVVLLVIIGGYFLFKASGARDDKLPVAAPKAAPVIKENWLVGVGGEVEGRSFLIGQRILTIGRTPQNAIQITDAQASRQHCQVKPIPGGLQIVDMNSSNATLINDKPCSTGQMGEGDELRIGEARFVYHKHYDAERDDRLGAKVGGAAMHRSTAQATNSPILHELVQKTYAAMDGDVERTAKALGVEAEIVQRILDEKTAN
jgi:hypothetical protein